MERGRPRYSTGSAGRRSYGSAGSSRGQGQGTLFDQSVVIRPPSTIRRSIENPPEMDYSNPRRSYGSYDSGAYYPPPPPQQQQAPYYPEQGRASYSSGNSGPVRLHVPNFPDPLAQVEVEPMPDLQLIPTNGPPAAYGGGGGGYDGGGRSRRSSAGSAGSSASSGRKQRWFFLWPTPKPKPPPPPPPPPPPQYIPVIPPVQLLNIHRECEGMEADDGYYDPETEKYIAINDVNTLPKASIRKLIPLKTKHLETCTMQPVCCMPQPTACTTDPVCCEPEQKPEEKVYHMDIEVERPPGQQEEIPMKIDVEVDLSKNKGTAEGKKCQLQNTLVPVCCEVPKLGTEPAKCCVPVAAVCCPPKEPAPPPTPEKPKVASTMTDNPPPETTTEIELEVIKDGSNFRIVGPSRPASEPVVRKCRPRPSSANSLPGGRHRPPPPGMRGHGQCPVGQEMELDVGQNAHITHGPVPQYYGSRVPLLTPQGVEMNCTASYHYDTRTGYITGGNNKILAQEVNRQQQQQQQQQGPGPSGNNNNNSGPSNLTLYPAYSGCLGKDQKLFYDPDRQVVLDEFDNVILERLNQGHGNAVEDDRHSTGRGSVMGVEYGTQTQQQKRVAPSMADMCGGRNQNICPYCGIGYFRKRTTVTGYLTAVLCFPCGLYCCLGKKICYIVECSHCHAVTPRDPIKPDRDLERKRKAVKKKNKPKKKQDCCCRCNE